MEEGDQRPGIRNRGEGGGRKRGGQDAVCEIKRRVHRRVRRGAAEDAEKRKKETQDPGSKTEPGAPAPEESSKIKSEEKKGCGVKT